MPTARTFRRAVAACVLAPTLAAAQSAQPTLPDAKELMAKHNTAIGSRALLDGHTSMRLAGTVSIAAMGMEATIEVFRAKPNKMVQKLVLGAMGEMIQGFDGTVAYAVPPAGMEPQVITGDAADQAKLNADFYSNFQDATVYSKAQTLELTDFEGKKCYKISVTRGTKTATEYFDQASGLIAGIQSTVEGQMGTVETLTIFQEYQDFGGLKFPSKIEQRAGPQVIVMQFKTIEFDKVDPAVFNLPEAIKAKLKP